jgi:hypothetical protein
LWKTRLDTRRNAINHACREALFSNLGAAEVDIGIKS